MKKPKKRAKNPDVSREILDALKDGRLRFTPTSQDFYQDGYDKGFGDGRKSAIEEIRRSLPFN